MTEKDHYKYGLSGDKVDVEVAERLRAQIRELKAQDEVHWKTRRSLLAELERCRAANVYDAEAHRKVAELEAAVRWALGEGDEDFPFRQSGQGVYWWRTELRRRSGLALETKAE